MSETPVQVSGPEMAPAAPPAPQPFTERLSDSLQHWRSLIEERKNNEGVIRVLHQDIDDLDIHMAMDLRRRSISSEQVLKFEGYMAEIFEAMGMDLNTPATEETPQRFIQALFDATEGYDGDPKLLKVFETECRGGPDCRLSQVIEGLSHFSRSVSTTDCPFTGMPLSDISLTSISSAFPSSPGLCDCLQSALLCKNGWGSRLRTLSIRCLSHMV